jgi:hypothetical protein
LSAAPSRRGFRWSLARVEPKGGISDDGSGGAASRTSVVSLCNQPGAPFLAFSARSGAFLSRMRPTEPRVNTRTNAPSSLGPRSLRTEGPIYAPAALANKRTRSRDHPDLQKDAEVYEGNGITCFTRLTLARFSAFWHRLETKWQLVGSKSSRSAEN